MFGRRDITDGLDRRSTSPNSGIKSDGTTRAAAHPVRASAASAGLSAAPSPNEHGQRVADVPARKTEEYYQLKARVFSTLIDAIDVSQLGKLDQQEARRAVGEVINEIIAAQKAVLSIAE